MGIAREHHAQAGWQTWCMAASASAASSAADSAPGAALPFCPLSASSFSAADACAASTPCRQTSSAHQADFKVLHASSGLAHKRLQPCGRQMGALHSYLANEMRITTGQSAACMSGRGRSAPFNAGP